LVGDGRTYHRGPSRPLSKRGAVHTINGKVSGPGGAAELLGMKPTTLTSRISALRVDRRKLN
jgi:hypothetical protein